MKNVITKKNHDCSSFNFLLVTKFSELQTNVDTLVHINLHCGTYFCFVNLNDYQS